MRVETIPGASSAHAESSQLSWALRSHPGCRRPDNEDTVAAFAPAEPDERGCLFVVCDGMGGHEAGEVASRMAAQTLLQTWTTNSPSALARPHQALRSAIRAANTAVFAASLDTETRGMGTTMTSLAIVGGEAIVGHVGDSRCYLVRSRQTSQLTADHSRVGEMLRMRLITPEQAANHPARSQLTRSLGGEPAVQVDIVRNPVAPDDSFVLCSDGIWDLVSMREIADAVAAGPDKGAEVLVDKALERGAPDNVTVVVVRMSDDIPMPDLSAGGSRLGFLKRAADRLLGG